MQHHRRPPLTVIIHVRRAQTSRHGKVRLYGAALPHPAYTVFQGKINFGAIKRAFTGLQPPLHPLGIKRLLQGLFGLVPDRIITYPVFRPGGQLHNHLVETEIAVNLEQQVNKIRDFRLDLRFTAKDMGIILGKPPDPHQAVQGPGSFIPVTGTEFRQAQRQVPVTFQTLVEHLYMTGTIHGFDSVITVFRTGGKHIRVKLVPMAGFLP